MSEWLSMSDLKPATAVAPTRSSSVIDDFAALLYATIADCKTPAEAEAASYRLFKSTSPEQLAALFRAINEEHAGSSSESP